MFPFTGGSLYFKNGVIKRANHCNAASGLAPGPYYVSQPQLNAVVSAVAVINIPQRIGPCDTIFVSGKGSYGSGGRELSYSWALDAVYPAGGAPGLQTVVQSTTSGSWVVNTNLITTATQINISLKVTNWLGSSNTTYVSFLIQGPDRLPFIYLNGPKFRSIRTSDTLDITSTTQLSPVTAATSFDVSPIPECSLSLGVVHRWAIASTHEITIPASQISSSSLSYKAKTLPVGTHSFVLTSQFANFTVLKDNTVVRKLLGLTQRSSVHIKVEASALKLTILGCNARVQSGVPRVNITLDASKSFDPDNVANGVNGWSFQWGCTRTFSGTECNTEDPIAEAKNDFGNATTKKSVLNIPSLFLPQATKVDNSHNYMVIKLDAIDPISGKTAVGLCRISTRIEPSPRVYVTSTTSNTLQRVVFTAITPDVTIPRDRSFFWFCTLTDDITTCPITLNSNVLLTTLRGPSLGLNLNPLPVGITLRFHVLFAPRASVLLSQLSSSQAGIGRAFYDFEAPPVPSLGTCFSAPSSGYAINTTFFLQCKNFVGGTNLRYGFRTTNGSLILASPRLNPVFPVTLSARNLNRKVNIGITAGLCTFFCHCTKYNFCFMLFFRFSFGFV